MVALVYFANGKRRFARPLLRRLIGSSVLGAYSQWAPNFSQWSKDTTQTGETVAYDQHYVLDGFTTVSNFAEFETSSDILTSSGFSKSVVGSRPVSAGTHWFHTRRMVPYPHRIAPLRHGRCTDLKKSFLF